MYDIAIVGGGFSGAMTALHLLRNSAPSSSILMIEKDERLGRGLAFGTTITGHLLNVPVENMSAFGDDPGHFLRWLRQHKDPNTSPGAFVSRQWYGEYVGGLLSEQLRQPQSPVFRRVTDEVRTIDEQAEAQRLTLGNGSQHHARFVVLAVGNFPPADLFALRHLSRKLYAPYAWSADALCGISDSDVVLLLGSGLTAVDQVVTLESRGFKGKVYMISLRGLLPAVHANEPAWSTDWTRDLPNSVRSIVAKVRSQIRLAAAAEVGWRSVIDSLRPETQRIWMGLDLAERRRFLRHVRPFWEICRHRSPPEVGRLLDRLRQEGRVMLHAGRVVRCVERDGYVEVTYRTRENRKAALLLVSRIINCTGHETDVRKIELPLLKSLLENKLVRVDPSLLGLDVSDDGAVIDGSGRPSKSLFAIGSARKGLLWESTAVPEIRAQAQRLSEQLVVELAKPKTVVSRQAQMDSDETL